MEFITKYFVAGIAIIVFSLLLYMKYLILYWKKKDIPFLEPTLLIGNFKNPFTTNKPLHTYFMEFHKQFREVGAEYGGVYAYITPIFMVLHPKYIKSILVKNFSNFHARGIYNNERDQPLSINLVSTDGERWRNLRMKFTHIFTLAKTKSMINLIIICSKDMEKYINKHAIDKLPLNAKDCASRFAVDVIGRCGLGIDCNSFEDNSFHELLVRLLQKTTSFIKFSLCIAFPNAARFFRIPFYPIIEADAVGKLIEKTIKYRIENNITRSDILQSLIEMKNENVINMTELKAESLMIFLTGYETSSCALTFLLFELANNQDIQDTLRNEIREVLNKHNGEITHEGIMSMKYLEMVLCETLRKYPTIPIITRKCAEDVVLPDTNISIEKGTNIVISISGLHHDSEYFPLPNKFDPDRFSEKNKNNIIPYTYLPFAEGPRNCIGERFAAQEIKIGVISIIRKFKIKLNASVQVPLEFASTYATTPKYDMLLDIETISV